MKHLSIVGKFFTIMAMFALFALGSTLYLARQTSVMDGDYNRLINGEQKAAVYLARSKPKPAGDALGSRRNADRPLRGGHCLCGQGTEDRPRGLHRLYGQGDRGSAGQRRRRDAEDAGPGRHRHHLRADHCGSASCPIPGRGCGRPGHVSQGLPTDLPDPLAALHEGHQHDDRARGTGGVRPVGSGAWGDL